MNIIEEIGEDAVILQLAEEAAELAQACTKYLRIKNYPQNYSPVSKEEALGMIDEEIADVRLCIKVLLDSKNGGWEYSDEMMQQKERRWVRRIKEAANG